MQTTRDLGKRAEEVIARCRKLASFSEDAVGTRRTFLSSPISDCHREIASWLEPLGAQVRLDAAGNLRAYYPGKEPEAPRLMLGSHLDTVANAGAFDGILGVVLAVALLECLDGSKLPFGIEVVGFSEEEGVRFGVPFIGSRALVGRLDQDLLSRQDAHGVSVRQAIQEFGLNADQLYEALLRDDVLGFLEFHIEQGPVLENLGKPLAAVESIVGQHRLEFTFSGCANHAGTTPMHLRHDALAAAAEWIIMVEKTARQTAGLVATVGFIEAQPGATNVIAGKARTTLDIRHASDDTRARTLEDLIHQAEAVAVARGVSVEWRTLLSQPAVKLDRFLVDQIEQAIRRAGCEPFRMTSGAGHDAMILSEKVPAAMVFVQSPGGISHDPAESVRLEDVAKALDCGKHLLEQLASSREFLGRTCRA